MKTLKIELTDSKAYHLLQELEDKHLIRILKEPDLSSHALPGESMSEKDFKKWVEYADDSPTLSIAEAKERWATQKERLQKGIR